MSVTDGNASAHTAIAVLAERAVTYHGEAEKIRDEVARLMPHLLAAFDAEVAVAQDRAEEGVYGKLVRNVVDADAVDTLPDPVPLIDGLLDADTVAWIYGAPGSFKSFLALHMSACVATGERFCGHSVKRPGTVLYLCAEGKRGLKKRVKAWERHYGRPMSGVRFLPVAVQLLDAEQLDALVRVCREAGPVLVVIDTQARCTVGVDENSNGQMGQVVAAADRIREATGACVLFVHHTGRDGKNARGASAMDGAGDAMIKVESDKTAGLITMKSEKQKDSANFPSITLRVQMVAESVILSHETVRISTDGEAEVLRVLTELLTEPSSPTKIVRLAETPESTTYRAIKNLATRGVLVNEGSEGRPRYRLVQG
ncbi:AAA family ATPase [Streptomyces sp. NPDC018964]|uniref:AAA family ATPase n=1 Tax=Streptomyces sp. NPDC018964 TaxID=3365058 RepID=UPI0037B619CB